MREIITPNIIVIEEPDGRSFQLALNKAFKDYSQRKNFRYDIQPRSESGHCAYLFFDDVEKHPESLEDAARLQGIKGSCVDCPYFDKPTDRRMKRGACPFAHYGQTFSDTPACEEFYRWLATGKKIEFER